MALLDLLVPPACSGCGAYGDPLCGACRSTFRPAANVRDRFVVADPSVVVGDDLEVAVAAFRHEGTLRRVLSRLKYGGASRLARPLADAAAPFLASAIQAVLSDTRRHALLVPVPVHPERQRQRGYNQAALLARHLAPAVGIEAVELLARRRPTTQQHRLNRTARLRNLRQAFVLKEGARSPPIALLVDDILTTSATLEACAAAMREQGGVRVIGFAIARET